MPVDVNVSTWDCAIEGGATSAPVHLGFSRLNSMGEDTAVRVELARMAFVRSPTAIDARRYSWPPPACPGGVCCTAPNVTT
nr:hypothetical protein [Burkholderia sp. BCC1630]